MRNLERRQRGLEISNPDDRSGDMRLVLADPDANRSFFSPCLWKLPDPGAQGARRTFLFGSASEAVDTVRWAPERDRACTCRTVPLPGEEARRAFIMPVGSADRGHAVALAADGSVLQEFDVVGRDKDEEQKPGEFLQRQQQLPKVGEGPLPDGDRWELRAGLLGKDLHHWVTHGSGGGGSGGPVMAQAETIRLVGCSRRPELQIAVGQVAKHVDAVRAFDQQGKRCHAERLRAAHLTVDLFLAWTTEPGLARVAALDNGGELLGECEVPTWPPSPQTI